MASNIKRFGFWCAAIAGSALLSGCMTTDGYGGYPSGGQYPQPDTGGQYPQQPYPGQSANQVVGTVQGVENGRLILTSDNAGSSGAYGGGSRIDVYFDQNTQLYYQGQSYPVTGLEPGDRIRIDAAQSGGRLWARSIEVLQNVRDGGQYGNQGGQYGNQGGQYGNELGGAVTLVDTHARLISFTRGGYSGATTQVRYDDRTMVEYRGRSIRPDSLQRGDVVRIQARQWGNEMVAERIVVETSTSQRY